MREEELLQKLEKFGTWMYKFQLTDNVSTKPHGDWLQEVHETRKKMIFPFLDSMFKDEWKKIRCLDTACNEGFFSFELCKRGAEVVGFDARKELIDKANFIKEHFGYSNLLFKTDDVYNLNSNDYGKFDLTLCLGLIYHLENPILALRKIREVTKLVTVIDTQVMKFNPKLGTQESIKTAFGTKNDIRETDAVIGLYDENCWSMTGLECYPNKAALYKMLKSVGFSEIIQLEPPDNAYEQYASFDRVIVIAKV